MDIEEAREKVYQGYIAIMILRSTNPDKAKKIVELQATMQLVLDRFEELFP